MSSTNSMPPKSPTTHLHAVNLIVALLAGIVSIVGGVYTIKNNFFPTQSYGSLHGVVRDAKLAKPLLLALVEVGTPEGAVVNTSTTDAEGRYQIEKLKTGSYEVRLSAARHAPQTKKVKIEKDIESSINVDLTPIEEPAAAPRTVERALPVVNANLATQNLPPPAAASQPYPAPTVPNQVPARTYQDYDMPGGTYYPNANANPYRRHHRPAPTGYNNSAGSYSASYDSPETTSQPDSGSGALVQAVLPIVQEMFAKKSNSDTATTSQ